MTSPIQQRAGKYRTSGATYEKITYDRDHLQSYLSIRSQELGRILREHFPAGQRLRILEVGCGTGLVLDYLSSLPEKHELFGADASEVMLGQAGDRLADRDPPVELLLASCDDLPYDAESFDVVVATRFIHLFSHDEKKRIFAVFQRLLRPGGISVVEFYARPFHWLRYRLTNARHKERDEFFSHYPTASEVRDIVNGPFRRRPVRLAGSRILYTLLRQGGLAAVTRRSELPGLNYLVDEYFVVTRRQ